MQQITAIQTRYGGNLYRSRTEARWAVFFDRLGLPWDYELEGFSLPNGLFYLPDFCLPTLGLLVEIKPLIDGEDVYQREDLVAFWRMAEAERTADGWQMLLLAGTPRRYEAYTNGDGDYRWCACPECDAVGIQYEGRAERNKHKPACSIDRGGKFRSEDHPLILAAVEAASMARFEHGETPCRS